MSRKAEITIDIEKIKQAKELLGDTAASIIAEELELESFDERNFKACCPIHSEKTPSFIWNSKLNNYHCFGCGSTIDIIDAFMMKGSTMTEAVQKLFDLTGIKHSFGETGIKTKRNYRYPKPKYADNNEKIYKYLERRKISRKTANYLNLRQGEDGNILIQYFDLNDVLTMVKVRRSEPVKKGEPKCWHLNDEKRVPFDTTPLLYNMNRTNYENPLLITSGELDCAAAIEAGYLNSVSIPMGDSNTHWVDENLEYLDKFSSIIICPDNDKSGAKFITEIMPRLGTWKCKIAKVPETFTSESGKVQNIKDLNEYLYHCGKEAVLDIIYNAKDTPVPSVRDLSEVDDIDLDEIDGIETGIPLMDKELMRLFYGTLTILSGMPGSGKSSILCQIICNALDQGKNCWMYSGELPEYMVKNWFNYIFAGPRNVETYVKPNSDEYYKIRGEIKGEINKEYKGRWFVYKDDYSNNLTELISSMTDVVRKYNVKLLILDNMMTIDAEAGENELREQTNTIKRLIEFSKKYCVATILVCHPRKLTETSTVKTYDISGSANIINLAHRTIGMRRITDEEKSGFNSETMGKMSAFKDELKKSDVAVNIIKDRMRGRSNKTFGLRYDPASRRFYSGIDEYNVQYKWDKTKYTSLLPPPPLPVDITNEVFGKVEVT